MSFLSRPATAADVDAATALVEAANAALIADCGVPAGDASLLIFPVLGNDVVVRDGVVWYGVSDASSMPWVGWVAADSAAANGLRLTDADVADPLADPADF